MSPCQTFQVWALAMPQEEEQNSNFIPETKKGRPKKVKALLSAK